MIETSLQYTCDSCGGTEVHHEMSVPKYEVRRYLATLGWKSFGALDYCKRCVGKGHAARRETDMNH